jgi:PPP family 3-phenylpropionic acid transporter
MEVAAEQTSQSAQARRTFAGGVIFPLRNVFIHDQGISLVLIGTLSTGGSMALSGSSFVVGRLSDWLGRRRHLAVGLLIMASATSLGFLRARDYNQFFWLTVLDMAGVGGYSLLIDAIVTSALPEKNRGGGFGGYRISGSLGFAVASAMLGFISSRFGIRAIFAVAAVAYAGAAVAASLMVEAETRRTSPALDVGRRPGFLRTLIFTGLIWFVLADLIAMIGGQIAFPFMNIYLDQALGASAGQIGFLSTVGVLAEIPAMLILGRLSDRYGRGPILVFGFLTTCLSWLLVYGATGLPLVYLARVLSGMGIVRYSVGIALLTDRAPNTYLGTLLSLSSLSFGLGGMIGPILGGLVAETAGVRPVFLLAAVVEVAATVLFMRSLRVPQPVLGAQPARVESPPG